MMKEFYVIKETKENSEVLETIKAKSLEEARKEACIKYMNIALSMTIKLLVVNKLAYEQR